MEANLAAERVEPRPARFPYSNWGPWAAVLGVILALGTGIVMGIPAAILGHQEDGDLTTFGSVGVQLATALGFLMVPMAIAAQRGAATLGEIFSRLGVRRFRPSAFKWMAAAVGAYLLFAMFYSLLIVEPKQEDIADSFGPVPVQILLIVIAASVSEEVCFRGMLFGGLRERLPRLGGGAAGGGAVRWPARADRDHRGAAADRLRLRALPALREDRVDRAGNHPAHAEQQRRPACPVAFRR